MVFQVAGAHGTKDDDTVDEIQVSLLFRVS
jgi:hypothetical protein